MVVFIVRWRFLKSTQNEIVKFAFGTLRRRKTSKAENCGAWTEGVGWGGGGGWGYLLCFEDETRRKIPRLLALVIRHGLSNG